MIKPSGTANVTNYYGDHQNYPQFGSFLNAKPSSMEESLHGQLVPRLPSHRHKREGDNALFGHMMDGSWLPISAALRFTDGAMLCSKEFVNEAFANARERYGPKRKHGARAMRRAAMERRTSYRAPETYG